MLTQRLWPPQPPPWPPPLKQIARRTLESKICPRDKSASLSGKIVHGILYLYSTAPDRVNLDQVTESTMKQFTRFTELPSTHMWASFGHLAGYSSAYYTYMWDLVIAQEFYPQFNQSNPMLGDVPAKYRKTVLEPGGSVSANDLVKNFLGRPQNTKAFRVWMSAEFAGSGSSGSSSGASSKLVSPTMRRRSDHA